MRKAIRPTRRTGNHVYYVDGVKCDGVTTLLNGGLPKPALVGWAARSVAEYVAEHRDVIAAMSDAEVMAFLPGVPNRDRDAKAMRGTAVHALAARIADGEEVDVPEAERDRIDAYLEWWHMWHPEPIAVERMVVNRRHRYAGTFDMLANIPGLGVTMLDLKTSDAGVYGDTALQLAAYGNAEVWIDDDGTERPMPKIDTYAVLWLPLGGWELHVYDVGEREFRTFLFCAEIARWGRDRNDRKAARPVVGEPLDRPAPRLEVVS